MSGNRHEVHAGAFVETGSAEQIFNAPMHPYTKGLLSCIPVPGKTERGSRLGSIPGVVPSLINGVSGCGFRSRCPVATEKCAIEPDLVNVEADHQLRCVHTAEYLRQMTWETAE